jgi:lipase ATG15
VIHSQVITKVSISYTKNKVKDNCILKLMKILLLLNLIRGVATFTFPNMTDLDLIIDLAKMTSNTYHHLNSTHWIDIPKWTQIDDIGYSNDSNGIRGYIYSHIEKDIIVVSFKGTSTSFFGINWGPTSELDKVNDNLMFSCCGTSDLKCESKLCDKECLLKEITWDNKKNPNDKKYYINSIRDIVENLKEKYKSKSIWFTGHSLGGGLASLSGVISGLPSIGFESPPIRHFLEWNNLMNENNKQFIENNVYNIGIYDDPIFMGECNGRTSFCHLSGYTLDTTCHVGKKCVMDVPTLIVQEASDNVPIDTENLFQHRIPHVINELLNKGLPECNIVKDCIELYCK